MVPILLKLVRNCSYDDECKFSTQPFCNKSSSSSSSWFICNKPTLYMLRSSFFCNDLRQQTSFMYNINVYIMAIYFVLIDAAYYEYKTKCIQLEVMHYQVVLAWKYCHPFLKIFCLETQKLLQLNHEQHRITTRIALLYIVGKQHTTPSPFFQHNLKLFQIHITHLTQYTISSKNNEKDPVNIFCFKRTCKSIHTAINITKCVSHQLDLLKIAQNTLT